MNQLFKLRFNIIDLIGGAMLCIFLSRGQWIMALVSGIALAGLSVIGHNMLKLYTMNRQWQMLVEQHENWLVPAIKKHRELFGSSLKDAVTIVRAYRDKKGLPQ
jgi:hypothetical protein